MLKKMALFLIVLVGVAAMNTGLFNKKIDMGFIKTPAATIMMGNQHEAEENKLQSSLEKLQKKTGTESQQQAISSQLEAIAMKDSVRTSDKTLLDMIFNSLRKSVGYVNNGHIMQPKSGRIYKMQFGYNVELSQNSMEDILKNFKAGYEPYMYIFPNDNAVLVAYDKNSKSKVSIVEARLDEKTIKYLDKFYSEQLKLNN